MKKIFRCLSLTILFTNIVFTPIMSVYAEIKGEDVEQMNSERLNETVNFSKNISNFTNSTERKQQSYDDIDGSTYDTEFDILQKSNKTINNLNTHAFSDQLTDKKDSEQEELSSWLPDKAFQETIAQRLKISVDEITKERMSRIEILYIHKDSSDIADLTGLEYATNLSKFYIEGNTNITDYSILTLGRLQPLLH